MLSLRRTAQGKGTHDRSLQEGSWMLLFQTARGATVQRRQEITILGTFHSLGGKEVSESLLHRTYPILMRALGHFTY